MSRRLKRVLVGLSGLVLLLVAAALIVPLLFRDRIDALAKARLNESLDADVEWQTFDVSLLRGFPDLTVTARHVTVCNRAPFDGICLARVDELSVRLGLASLVTGAINIKGVGARRPRVQLAVHEDGVANWDITRAGPTAPDGSSSSALHIALRDYWIEDAQVTYADASSAWGWELAGLDHRGRGAFRRGQVTLDTTTHVDAASLLVRGIAYVKQARLDVDADLQIDESRRRVTLSDTEIRINDLVIGVDGSVARTDDALDLDLGWTSRKSDLTTLLSLMPATLVGDLQDVETAGTVVFTGRATGLYGEQAVPGLDVRISVQNGRLKYASLPASADQIALEATLQSQPARDWDSLIVDVARLTTRVAGHPIDARIRLGTLVSDPVLDGELRADLDLADLARVVPFTPGDTLAGHAAADVRLQGRLSALEKAPYEAFTAEGYLNLSDVVYQRRASNRGFRAAALSLTFNPRHLQLLAEGAGIGETDVTIRGRFENYLTWWLGDDVLRGTFDMSGSTVNLTGLMRTGDPAMPVSAPAGVGGVAPAASRFITIPEDVDVTIAATARRVTYGPIELGGVKGSLRLHDRRAELSNVGFGLFGGSVTLNGSYDTSDPARPAVALTYDAKLVDIQQAARQSAALQRVAPIAQAATGTFSSTLEIAARLDHLLSLDLASLTGRGTVTSESVRLDEFAPLAALARSLKLDRLESATLPRVRFSFILRDGRMITSPFEVQLDGLALRVGGSTVFATQAIDYDLTGRVPTSLFGATADQRVTEWLERDASRVPVPAFLGMTARLAGTITQPSIRLAFDDGGAASAIRGVAMAKARAEADRLLAEAEDRAQEIRGQAEQAVGRLRAEASAAAQRLLDRQDGPLAQAAARIAAGRLRQEAETQATQLISEANSRAQALVDAARQAGAEQVEAAVPK